jgi:hypothetical protein
MKPQIEKQLIGRLKFIGWVMFVCAVSAHVYKYIPQTGDEFDVIEEDIGIEFKEAAPLNTFLVSSVFTIVGVACFLISWKKKKDFLARGE